MNAHAELVARAWRAGPGFGGRREALDGEGRAALADELRAAGLGVPAFLRGEASWVDRRAKLFQAGEYPDKGLTIGREDLDRLAAAFAEPVPVWIEHAASPLQLGYLTEVAVQNDELYGVVTLTAEADALARKSGAGSLSLGLSPDLDRILEVSLVRSPRVADARLFTASLDGFEEPAPAPLPVPPAEPEELRRWRREGRVTPAQAPLVAALLTVREPVRFDGASLPVADLVRKLVAASPTVSLFADVAPQPPVEDLSYALLTPEEAAWYRKHFPDISLEQIAKMGG